MPELETFYDMMRRQGITRRSFLKFCSLTAAALGLGSAFAPKIAEAMETCCRRPHFDAGQFVEEWDDDAARKGYCLYRRFLPRSCRPDCG